MGRNWRSSWAACMVTKGAHESSGQGESDSKPASKQAATDPHSKITRSLRTRGFDYTPDVGANARFALQVRVCLFAFYTLAYATAGLLTLFWEYLPALLPTTWRKITRGPGSHLKRGSGLWSNGNGPSIKPRETSTSKASRPMLTGPDCLRRRASNRCVGCFTSNRTLVNRTPSESSCNQVLNHAHYLVERSSLNL